MEVDKIILVSDHSRDVYKNTSYALENPETGERIEDYRAFTPMDTVNYAVRDVGKAELDFDFDFDFNFLSIAQWSSRKNLENCVRWFIEEFYDKEVGLVLKTNTANNCLFDLDVTKERIDNLLKDFSGDRKCKIHLLHGDMSEQEMSALYTHPKIKACISTTHGEGFGLPLFEAAYNALPVIAPAWSGQCDFLYIPERKKNGKVKNKPMFSRVEFTMGPVQKDVVWDGVLIEDSMWCYPKENSFKAQMREMWKDWGRFKKRAEKLTQYLVEDRTEEKIYARFVDSFLGKKLSTPRPVTGVSFCIPTNGKREAETRFLIESIKRQKGAKQEIVLCGDVTNFSDLEGTVKLINKNEEAHTRKVAALRNAAADQAKYEVICYCDDDILLEEDWLEKTVEFSSLRDWDVLSNKVLCPDGTRYWDRALLHPHVLVDYDFPECSRALYQCSCFFLVRKSVFNDVRWDETKLVYADRDGSGMPEDVKYSLDLVQSGHRLSFNPDATTWHNDDTYTQFTLGNDSVTLKKDVIKEKFDMQFFLPHAPEFDELVSGLEK
jgi:hypothetical protein